MVGEGSGHLREHVQMIHAKAMAGNADVVMIDLKYNIPLRAKR